MASTAPLVFDGVLFFPVTPYRPDGTIDDVLLAEHVSSGVEQGAGGVFIACGTGELHALSLPEYEVVVRAGVEAAAGRVPVLAGVGGAFGQAALMVASAEAAGADGLLILPPYLVSGPQDGVVAYIEQLAALTALPLIAYHRGSAALSLRSFERLCALENLAGLKDGVGDVALAQQFVRAAHRLGRSDLRFFNGLLTAEASQAAYTAIGVPLYSSAAFAMIPEVALAFHRAHRAGDAETQHRLLDGFYTPLIALRDQTPGFAVSLIKAGLRLQGHAVGGVRPPLMDPRPEQMDRLAEILDTGRSLVR